MRTPAWMLFAALVAGCSKEPAPAPAPIPEGFGPLSQAPRPIVERNAEVGKPAPDFTLKDYDGKPVHLADLRGHTVVLEWFNPDCPFVKASHTKGSLKGLAKRWTAKGVVWLAVNSAAPGKQGHDADRVSAGKKAFEIDHPVLADESGQVGRQYGATNTPHMFIIDARGTLVYRGAIDNSADGEGESPTGGTLINYVDVALQALAGDKPIDTKETRAYGCSVKYGS